MVKPKSSSTKSTEFIGRTKAIRKLQVNLADFRRLCILKGIYPRVPKKKPKGKDQTYYHEKDIRFLAREPLLRMFRDQKVFAKRVRKAMGRQENSIARDLKRREPICNLSHLVKERYPTFMESLADLDDCISSIALFAALPADTLRDIPEECVRESAELLDQWHLYVATTGALRKVFASIKGYYFQAQVLKTDITWLLPHAFCQNLPGQVDYRVMLTFLEFYRTMARFVNFKLYSMGELSYPPKMDDAMSKHGLRFAALSCETLRKPNCPEEQEEAEDDVVRSKGAAEDEEHVEKNPRPKEEERISSSFLSKKLNRKENDGKNDCSSVSVLFRGLVFYLSREVPRIPLLLILRSCGAAVGWQDECSPYLETDPAITHHIVDRPLEHLRKVVQLSDGQLLTREYIQPQWVLDSLNAAKLLPIAPYNPDKMLPPHLSPFDNAMSSSQLSTTIKNDQGEEDDKLPVINPETDFNPQELSEDEEKAADFDITKLEAERMEKEIERELKGDATENDTILEVNKKSSLKAQKKAQKQNAERERRKAMVPRKHKWLVEHIEATQKSSAKRKH